ncbi:ATP-binding protein [Thioalkalivibrio paradoxus]|uniref:histidine kinase n=1 Tax=Thioalkalivibrio paradoxus ARh 1 TaxID=713585 RepID=W0DLP5_9GAMM|nr:ATP-binding protein [Thioalkalivibrio paradoxus]AHE98157.1 histidine kinase [Thioalkalivibrio paradoxus ARh 1]
MPTAPIPVPQPWTARPATLPWVWLAGRSAMLIALYYAVGLWGFVFTPDAHGIPLVWPATGVGLAFVYLYGYRLIPAVGFASALVAWQFTGDMVPLLETLGTVTATMAGVALGAYALHRLGFSPRLERLRDVGLLLSVGALTGSGLAATAGAWGIAVGMDELSFTDTWWLCWMADLMGLALVAPVLMTWLGAPLARPTDRAYLKGFLLIASLISVTAVVYSGFLPAGVAMPLSYAAFPLVMLAALRCPVQVTTTLMLAGGGIALSGTGWGLGPFAELGLDTSLLSLNAQLALLVLTGLVLTALRGEREAAETRARRHLDQLARAGRLSTLGELSAGLAHELNQPLCALASYAQASKRLLERGRMDELREALSQLDAGAHRAAETVRQMRAFAAGQAPERRTIRPDALVRPVLDLLRPDFRSRHLRLELKVEPHLPAVTVAPVQIEQVLVNLLRNAIEALEGRRDGRVELGLQREADHLQIHIRDNGPGIPPYRLAGLFDPFSTWKENGLGLGLSISRSLVEAHGGCLTVRNMPEGGAEFRFTLPLEHSDART